MEWWRNRFFDRLKIRNRFWVKLQLKNPSRGKLRRIKLNQNSLKSRKPPLILLMKTVKVSSPKMTIKVVSMKVTKTKTLMTMDLALLSLKKLWILHFYQIMINQWLITKLWYVYFMIWVLYNLIFRILILDRAFL